MGIRQAKIDCMKCGCPLEMPEWEERETAEIRQMIHGHGSLVMPQAK